MGPELFNVPDAQFEKKTVAAAEGIIGPPPTATPEQLAAAKSALENAGRYEAAPQKAPESSQDPNLDERFRQVHITTIEAQKPLK